MAGDQLDAMTQVCRTCGANGIYVGLLLGLAVFLPLGGAIMVPRERAVLKVILVAISAIGALTCAAMARA